MTTDSERDWEQAHADVHNNYVHDSARDYLKHTQKHKDDDYFSGTPITTDNGVIARAIVSLVCDRTGILTHEVDQLVRKDLQDISEQIIAQGLAADTTTNLYERLTAVDHPTTQADLDDERIDKLSTEMRYFYGLAETWSALPDLTVAEACHAVARAAYAARFDDRIPHVEPAGEFNPDRVYDAYFNMNHADDIKNRRARAAKELFGDSFNHPVFGTSNS